MNSLVERLSLSKRRVGVADVCDLLQDLRQQIEQARAAEMQGIAGIRDGLAIVEKGLQPTVERLNGEMVAAMTRVIQGQFEIAETRMSGRVEEIARRVELLDEFARTTRGSDREQLYADLVAAMTQVIEGRFEIAETRMSERIEEIARQVELLDEFARTARRSDRDQLDKVGTIAQGVDGFLRFTQADDRAQLDQIGSLSTHLHRDLNLLAEQQREAFERINQAIVALAAAAPALIEPRPGPDPALFPSFESRRNLFVVGHARSGTSILLAALNTSPDIFLFGEANFHFHEHLTDFREWYNRLQYSFGTPHTKSHYCPELFSRSATCREYVLEMGKHYRWVGEKIAFSAASEDYGFDSFSRYHESNFFDSRYICVARHPYATIVSNSVMFKTVDIRLTIRSYVKTLMKIIELSSFYPNVRVLIHEAIDRKTFEKIGAFIDADLSHAIDCYADDKQRELSSEEAVEQFGERHRDLLERIWQRFLEFYDAEALVIRENEGRLPYVLLEYAEMIAAIDAELAQEKALAESVAPEVKEAAPPPRRKAAKAPRTKTQVKVNGEAAAPSVELSAGAATRIELEVAPLQDCQGFEDRQAPDFEVGCGLDARSDRGEGLGDRRAEEAGKVATARHKDTRVARSADPSAWT